MTCIYPMFRELERQHLKSLHRYSKCPLHQAPPTATVRLSTGPTEGPNEFNEAKSQYVNSSDIHKASEDAAITKIQGSTRSLIEKYWCITGVQVHQTYRS